MEYKVDTSIEKFFKIVITGSVKRKSDLTDMMSEIIRHPDYEKKHTLWDYSSAKFELNMDDITELSGILKLIKPKTEKFANKSVLVVSGKMDKAKVDFFISLTKQGPLDFRIYTDITSAESYLLKL